MAGRSPWPLQCVLQSISRNTAPIYDRTCLLLLRPKHNTQQIYHTRYTTNACFVLNHIIIHITIVKITGYLQKINTQICAYGIYEDMVFFQLEFITFWNHFGAVFSVKGCVVVASLPWCFIGTCVYSVRVQFKRREKSSEYHLICMPLGGRSSQILAAQVIFPFKIFLEKIT